MFNDKLKTNDDKIDFLFIGTSQQLTKVTISSLRVGNSVITPVSSARNLGSWFDAKLSMATNITRTCNSVSYDSYNLRRIRKYLSKENKKLWSMPLSQAELTIAIVYSMVPRNIKSTNCNVFNICVLD